MCVCLVSLSLFSLARVYTPLAFDEVFSSTSCIRQFLDEQGLDVNQQGGLTTTESKGRQSTDLARFSFFIVHDPTHKV